MKTYIAHTETVILSTLKYALFLLGFMIGFTLTLVMISMANAAHAATLKNNVVLEADHFTVGDVFDGVKHNGDYVLGPSPAPGEKIVLGSSSLSQISQAFNLGWTPVTRVENVVLKRSGHVIDADVVEREIKDALKQKGLSGSYSLIPSNGSLGKTVPNEVENSISVSSVTFDASSDRFTAELRIPASGPVHSLETVSGHIQRTATIPVLNKRLRAGDVIGAGDIDWMEMPDYELQHDTILDAKNVIGMTPRRYAIAMKPLKQADLQMPVAVERGDTVTMVLKTDLMTLTAEGRALSSGAVGDTIKVVNVDSNHVIDAYVTGIKTVSVRR